jgi:N,N-dimethylformamidase
LKRTINHAAMPAVGYVEPWSVVAGTRTALHLSSTDEHPAVRIVCLDGEPIEAVHWKPRVLKDPIEIGRFEQGSWLELPLNADRSVHIPWCLSFEFCLTGNTGSRTILAAPGFRIEIDASRQLSLRGGEAAMTADRRLENRQWYEMSVRRTESDVEVQIREHGAHEPLIRMQSAVTADGSGSCLSMGSSLDREAPTVNARIGRIRWSAGDERAEWSFAPLGPLRNIPPASGRWSPIKVHNMPTFSVTSARWNGAVMGPSGDASHYDAVHLHDDDIGNFDWEATHEVDVPENARSGVYAFEVITRTGTERMPFFVRPSRPSAALLFLVPTNTYLAYADEYLPAAIYPWLCSDRGQRFAQDNNLRSLYDVHSDRSGVTLTTRRRPKATLRDDYEYPLSNSPHLLPVDLHLLRFCRNSGIEIDILTDHDLHVEGSRALTPYAGVLTGSHPEYWSSQMLTALDRFLDGGGNLAYLGGNGFYLSVALDDDVMELRRDAHDGIWSSAAGESHLALTGEPGGTWESRGRHPQSLLGCTYLMMSFGPSRPYTRLAGSRIQEWAWVFDRVGDQPVGDWGLVLGAAAGYEVDAVVEGLPVPPSLVRLATAEDFDSSFQVRKHLPVLAGPRERERLRRADMTIYRHSGGGLVFSVGSVAWCGALPFAGSRNAVGEITSNIARRFAGTPT